MELIDGESCGGGGRPCPPSLNKQGSNNEVGAGGLALHSIQASPAEVGVIDKWLTGEVPPEWPADKMDGWRRQLGGWKLAGVIFLLATFGGGVGYAEHLHQVHGAHHSQVPTSSHGAARQSPTGRRRMTGAVPDGSTEPKPETENFAGDAPSPNWEGDDSSIWMAGAVPVSPQPVCAYADSSACDADWCFHRRLDGRCRRSAQPCRLLPARVVAAWNPAANEHARQVYLLRKYGEIWHLVFGGRPGFISDDRAMQLVAYLLLHPSTEPMHAVPLAGKVWPRVWDDWPLSSDEAEEAGMAVQPQSSGAQLNKGENYLLKKRFRELLEIIGDATLHAAEREAAQVELDELDAALDGVAGRTLDNAAKTAERMRKLISRLHRKLAEATDENNQPHLALREFAEHLRRHLMIPSSRYGGGRGTRNRAGVAGTFVYEPPPEVVWNKTTPTFNSSPG